ncbi:hypothetical protein KUCAC02_011198, partial [Chaenocephalus aceratus]
PSFHPSITLSSLHSIGLWNAGPLRRRGRKVDQREVLEFKNRRTDYEHVCLSMVAEGKRWKAVQLKGAREVCCEDKEEAQGWAGGKENTGRVEWGDTDQRRIPDGDTEHDLLARPQVTSSVSVIQHYYSSYHLKYEHPYVSLTATKPGADAHNEAHNPTKSMVERSGGVQREHNSEQRSVQSSQTFPTPRGTSGEKETSAVGMSGNSAILTVTLTATASDTSANYRFYMTFTFAQPTLLPLI